jgi:hypothetical protein
MTETALSPAHIALIKINFTVDATYKLLSFLHRWRKKLKDEPGLIYCHILLGEDERHIIVSTGWKDEKVSHLSDRYIQFLEALSTFEKEQILQIENKEYRRIFH